MGNKLAILRQTTVFLSKVDVRFFFIKGSNIAVFGASDGWGLYTEDTEGTARILAWKTNEQGRIFYKKITISKSSKEESVLRFPRYLDLSNYLIKVQVMDFLPEFNPNYCC